jgi:hypothetical protein
MFFSVTAVRRSEGEMLILWCVGSTYARYNKILERRRLHTMAGRCDAVAVVRSVH